MEKTTTLVFPATPKGSEIIRPQVLKDDGLTDGWQVSFDCPDHGLVYGEFVRIEHGPEGLVMVVLCEDHLEERRLALYRED